MKSSRSYSTFAAACLAGLLAATVRADEASSTIKFSDPSKPGTVKISVGRGELTVQGADTKEVTIKSDAKAITSKPRKDGLRIISSASSFALSEKDNVVTVDSAVGDFGRGGGNFKLTVPRNTAVVVNSVWGGGDITCRSLSGDIEVKCMNGEIKLEDISGSVVAGTMHGEIRASISELHEGKPLSFTTMNGEVQLRLPESAKASVRLRTQNGSVLTDFDESVLQTKTETTPGMPRKSAWTMKSSNGKVLTSEVEDAIREATRVSATAVQEALQAVKEGLESSKIENDEARQKLDEANREIEKARREADRTRRNNERTARTAKPVPAVAPVPPVPEVAPAPGTPPAPPTKMFALPTITGGKLVTGTLNGGGPEISVSTMNGDVILRKQEKK